MVAVPLPAKLSRTSPDFSVVMVITPVSCCGVVIVTAQSAVFPPSAVVTLIVAKPALIAVIPNRYHSAFNTHLNPVIDFTVSLFVKREFTE
jgi:hypothetical protein